MAKPFAEVSQKGLRRFFDSQAEEMAPSGVFAFFCTGRRDRAPGDSVPRRYDDFHSAFGEGADRARERGRDLEGAAGLFQRARVLPERRGHLRGHGASNLRVSHS